MARQFSGDKIVVASHNAGKVKEIGELLNQLKVDPISAGDLNLPEPEETGLTFIENSELKALASALGSNLPSLADDSGLVVPSLGGYPGIYSARWAGPKKDFKLAMKKVMEELGGKDRSAFFVCALSLAWPDGHTETFEGKVHGSLIWPMRGKKGFGYDPIFKPNGFEVSFAEMDPLKKHAMSHRANAFKLLLGACFEGV
ncbi:MAG: RdgB/HAM1 family non-canonical purine NTP pyrophosphatase [Sphingomonadales bacterium]|jgi:XTP/dITP diphosphohydrolase